MRVAEKHEAKFIIEGHATRIFSAFHTSVFRVWRESGGNYLAYFSVGRSLGAHQRRIEKGNIIRLVNKGCVRGAR
jgi:hypothetical protein